MILVDTSVWISFLRKDNPDLVDILKKYLKKNEVYTVSAVFGELFQGIRNKSESEILQTLWESLPKGEEKNLFIKAGQLSNKYKLYAKGVGLIDCYILAASLENDAALWTLDKKLQEAFDIVASSESSKVSSY